MTIPLARFNNIGGIIVNESNKLLSDIVAFRTYAKHLPHLGRRESLSETINRNMTMHLDRFPSLSRDIVKAYQRVHELKVMPSMRALQFSGDAILKNHARQYNCSFVNMDDIRAFGEILYLLLSGVGVGFSVQKRHISQLPKISKPVEEGFFVVQDSISGWAQALDILLESYFLKRIRPQFDFGNIRPKGSYLVTTGAKAPGPEPLKKMLELVEERLKKSIGRRLTPLEVHDLNCIISDAVLAGGIRRAALISLFDKDDNEMLTCKSGDWWNHAPWRARSNNSVVLHRDEVTKEEFYNIFNLSKESGSGEPGFFWTDNMDIGTNPCCFSGNTTLLTTEGKKTFKELSYTAFKAINYIGQEVPCVVFKTGKKKTIKLSFSVGESITCTEDHAFMEYETGKEILAKDSLGKILKVSLQHHTGIQVSSLSLDEEQDVYDFSLFDDTHWGIVGDGVVAHNCEISLNSNQFCNLTTINQTGITNEKDFMNRVYAATLIGTLQASYTDFNYIRPSWSKITEKEALLGVSFTGIADSSNFVTPDLLQKGATFVKEVNEKYAKKLGINIAARTTTVKPEGTSSVVLGSSSGIHARHSDYYIRRIRMNKDDSLAVYLKNAIPDLVENDLFSSTGVVVSIPQESPKNSIIRNNETALTQFERAIMYRSNWIEYGHTSGDNKHNVSVTISVKDNEWDSLCDAMWENRDKYSGISLLPYDGGSYQQAPFEECDEKTFNDMSKLVKTIDLRQVVEENDNTIRIETVACAGGSCEVM